MGYEHIKTHRKEVKNRIIYVLGGKCACCGYDKCNEALEVHHLNPEEKEFTIGDSYNLSWDTLSKELRNCVLLCANCHRELHQNLINITTSSFSEERNMEIINHLVDFKTRKKNYCKICGKEIDIKAEYCVECYRALQKEGRPEPNELMKLISQLGFEGVGRLYNVSGNAIKKWCIAYGLPSLKQEVIDYVKKLE